MAPAKRLSTRTHERDLTNVSLNDRIDIFHTQVFELEERLRQLVQHGHWGICSSHGNSGALTEEPAFLASPVPALMMHRYCQIEGMSMLVRLFADRQTFNHLRDLTVDNDAPRTSLVFLMPPPSNFDICSYSSCTSRHVVC